MLCPIGTAAIDNKPQEKTPGLYLPVTLSVKREMKRMKRGYFIWLLKRNKAQPVTSPRVISGKETASAGKVMATDFLHQTVIVQQQENVGELPRTTGEDNWQLA